MTAQILLRRQVLARRRHRRLDELEQIARGAVRHVFMKLSPASCGASLRPARSAMWQLAQLA